MQGKAAIWPLDSAVGSQSDMARGLASPKGVPILAPCAKRGTIHAPCSALPVCCSHEKEQY